MEMKRLAPMLDLTLPASLLEFCRNDDKNRAYKSEYQKKPSVKRKRSKGARINQAQRIIDDRKAKASGTYYLSGIKFADGDTSAPPTQKNRKSPTCSVCGIVGHNKSNKKKCRLHADHASNEVQQVSAAVFEEGALYMYNLAVRQHV